MQVNIKKLKEVYGETEVSGKRYNELALRFKEVYGHDDGEFFSSPGRCEIIGNHLDHNGGKVIAGSVTMDTVAIAALNDSDIIRIKSDGYREVIVDLNNLERYKTGKGSDALVAGMCEALQKYGYQVHGFDTCMTSNVISAAGVSSSASFAMAIVSIINYFFNDGRMSFSDYAHIGQYAENNYWFKASGMLDQMACAIGGPVLLDFANEKEPKYEKLDFAFDDMNYQLFIINTGESHADLNAEYSSIPNEMKEAAKTLGVERLCESDLGTLLKEISKIKNDRAKLRSIHFYKENERVNEAVLAINKKDYKSLLKLINASGKSSFELLENCYVNTAPYEQKVALALALANLFIEKIGEGACRVHGGGFKGTILCLINKAYKNDFIEYMADYFDREFIYDLDIRRFGAIHI